MTDNGDLPEWMQPDPWLVRRTGGFRRNAQGGVVATKPGRAPDPLPPGAYGVCQSNVGHRNPFRLPRLISFEQYQRESMAAFIARRHKSWPDFFGECGIGI